MSEDLLVLIRGDIADVKAKLDDLQEEFREVGQGSDEMARRLVSAKQALDVIVDVGQRAFATLKEGAVSLELKEAFATQVEGAGQSADQFLARLDRAAGGTITDFGLMANASKSMSLKVTSDMDQMASLLEIARFKARKFGIDTSQAFGDITTGVGRNSKLILDNLGIIVNVEQANRDYAASIGKTAAQLTEAEQVQALLNAVLIEGQREIAAAGGLVDTTADQYRQLQVELENTKAKWQEVLALSAARAMSDSNPIAGVFNPGAAAETLQQMQALNSAFAGLKASVPVNAVDEFLLKMDLARGNMEGFYETLGRIPHATYAWEASFASATDQLGMTQGALAAVGEEFQVATHLIDHYNTLTTETADVSGAAGKQVQGAAEATAILSAEMLGTVDALAQASGGMDFTGSSAVKLANELYTAADAAAATQAALRGLRAEQNARLESRVLSMRGKAHQGQYIPLGGRDMISVGAPLESSISGYIAGRTARYQESNAEIERSTRRAMSAAGKAHKQAASEAERAAEKAAKEYEKSWENAVGEVRSAVSGAIDLDISVSRNDTLLTEAGMYQDQVNEAGRRLEDIINRGSASPNLEFFPQLVGLDEPTLKASAALLQERINKFLEPGLLNKDAILKGARETLIGNRNKAALVEELTQQLIGEGFAVADVQKTLGQQMGVAFAGTGQIASTELVDSVVSGLQKEVSGQQAAIAAEGDRLSQFFVDGIRKSSAFAGLADAIVTMALKALAEAGES